MGGWVDLGGWLCTRMVHLSADSHTSSPSTVVSRLRWWRPNHICRHVCGMWRRKCMLKLFVRSMTKLILFVCVYWRRGMGRVQVPPFCPKFQFVRNFFSEIQNLGFWTANFGRNLGGGGQKWTFQFTGTFSVRSLQKNSTSCVTAPPQLFNAERRCHSLHARVESVHGVTESGWVYIHCVSKKTGPLLPFAITPTVLVQ